MSDKLTRRGITRTCRHARQRRKRNSFAASANAGDRGQRLYAAHYVVHVDNRDIRGQKAKAPHDMPLRRGGTECRKYLAVSLLECDRTVHGHSKEICKRSVRCEVIGIGLSIARVPGNGLLSDDPPDRGVIFGVAAQVSRIETKTQQQ